MSWLAPYWEALCGSSVPDRPTSDDAVEALTQLGYAVHTRRGQRQVQMIGELDDGRVVRVGRRLCLPEARLAELRAVMDRVPPPAHRDAVTVWW